MLPRGGAINQALEEAICDLRAQVYTLRNALRAPARTPPVPAALQTAWREAQKASAALGLLAPTYPHRSDHLADRGRTFAEDWNGRVVGTRRARHPQRTATCLVTPLHSAATAKRRAVK